MIQKNDLPLSSGFVAFVKRDCPTCELVVPVLGNDRAKRLIALCASLDDASSIEPLVALMRFQTS